MSRRICTASEGMPLTPREVQVARALIDFPELTVEQLAPKLRMKNAQIVKNAARLIYRKTGTKSRVHLLDWAYKTGAKRV